MSVQLTRLPSGLTIASHHLPHLETVALGIYVRTGGRNELEHEHGLAHLLEHMAFKGTSRRSACDIAEQIEAVGGDLNASTSSEQTGYYARVLRSDLGLGMDILSDILAHPTFDAEELRKEQNVIVQEIGAADDTPDDLVFDMFQDTAFQNQPFGRSILGTVESVTSFTRDHLFSYLNRTYRAPDMVVAAAGAVDHAQLVDEAMRRLSSFGDEKNSLPQPARYCGGVRTLARDLEQVHLVLGFEGVPYSHEDYYASQVFTSILGGGMSSRLFQEVREKRGLCYTISAFHWPSSDTGLFGVYAGTDPRDVKDLMQLTAQQIHDVVDSVSSAEIARVKAQVKVSLLMALESSSSRADQLARQIFAYGRVLEMDDILRRIDAVDEAAVRRAGMGLLARGAPTLTALGSQLGIEEAVSAFSCLKSLDRGPKLSLH